MTVPLVVGNWKANGLQAECLELAGNIARAIRRRPAAVEVALAPPYTGLAQVKKAIEKSRDKTGGAELPLGRQRCFHRGDYPAHACRSRLRFRHRGPLGTPAYVSRK